MLKTRAVKIEEAQESAQVHWFIAGVEEAMSLCSSINWLV